MFLPKFYGDFIVPFCRKKECLIDRILFKKKSPASITKSRGLSSSQDINVFSGQSLVHAADSTEFSTHAAGVAVVILRSAAVPDRFWQFRDPAHRHIVSQSSF